MAFAITWGVWLNEEALGAHAEAQVQIDCGGDFDLTGEFDSPASRCIGGNVEVSDARELFTRDYHFKEDIGQAIRVMIHSVIEVDGRSECIP